MTYPEAPPLRQRNERPRDRDQDDDFPERRTPEASLNGLYELRASRTDYIRGRVASIFRLSPVIHVQQWVRQQRARLVRDLANCADPFIKRRLLDLASRYEAPPKAKPLALPSINSQEHADHNDGRGDTG